MPDRDDPAIRGAETVEQARDAAAEAAHSLVTPIRGAGDEQEAACARPGHNTPWEGGAVAALPADPELHRP